MQAARSPSLSNTVRLALQDGEETLVYVTLPVEHPEAPKDTGVVRADGYAGYERERSECREVQPQLR